jgi:hypothetical protein
MWKKYLYDLYTIVSFLLHIPFFLLQIMGVYAYWGNVQIVSGIIFQMTVCFDGLVILVYFTYHRKYLLQMFEKLRTEFLPYINKVGLAPKQAEIMREKTKFASILTTVYIVIFVVVMSAWCVLPFFVKCWSYQPQVDSANLTDAGEHFEYFVIATWMPDNAIDFPTYEIIYASQFLYIWSIVANFTVGNMVFSTIYFGISLQFRLLAAAIRDIDNICIDVRVNPTQQDNDYSEGTWHDTNTEAYQRATPEGVTQASSSMVPPSVEFLHKEMSAEASMASMTDFVKRGPIAENETNINETAYMIECINYHQCLLK